MPETETWRNATRGRVWVKKFGADGKLRDEIVASDRVVHLTPQERLMNQEMAAREDMDVFNNGILQPVRLIDGSEEAKEIAGNPNHITDDDITKLVKSHHKTLDARLKDISNPAALQRMLEVAKEQDASFSTVGRIKERLGEVAPEMVNEITQVTTQTDPQGMGGIRPVTPR